MSVTSARVLDSVTQDAGFVVTDPADVRLLRALQLSPRASFARLGELLGVPERTLGRRYRALHANGALRIVGVPNARALGQQVWMVRVRCRPDGAAALARALAQRDDLTWVTLHAAGSEIHFSVRAVSEEQRDILLTRRLPRASHVLGIEASVVLHQFVRPHAADWSVFADLLTEQQTAALRADAPAPDPVDPHRPIRLDADDRAILAALAQDGRAGPSQLARAAGISEGRATRRLAALLRCGAVVIDVDVAGPAFGYNAKAALYLRVTPARLPEIGQALAAIPEVGFAAATSGPYNLIAAALCRDLTELYELTSGRIGTLSGVQSMEISPLSRAVKQAGALVGDQNRLESPARRSRAAPREPVRAVG